MNAQETTNSYVELANQAYSLFVDAVASSNQRALEYGKSVFEITSRPYASSAIDSTVRENFDRANEIVSLSVTELQVRRPRSSPRSCSRTARRFRNRRSRPFAGS